MRKIFLILTLALEPFLIFAQDGQLPFEIRAKRWTEAKRGQAPVNVDTVKFEEVISSIEYPPRALKMNNEGDVIAIIEIDENGEVVNYKIKKDGGADTRGAVTKVLFLLPTKWTPAVVNGDNVESRLTLLFRFHSVRLASFSDADKYYKSYSILAIGNGKWVTKRVNRKKKE